MSFQLHVELRPRLQAAQFYILAEIPPDSIKLQVFKNHLRLPTTSGEVNVALEPLRLLPGTLSCLSTGANSVRFRVEVEVDTEAESGPTVSWKPSIKLGKETTLSCRCCGKRVLSRVFERCLPLPSSQIDGVEFFCHGDAKISADPRPTDCLYGRRFYQVKDSLDEGDVECDRCLSWLGCCKKGTVQLWNSTVCFTGDCESVGVVALRDFTELVREVAEGVGSKIVFRCPSVGFLLLWIMEKNLTLYQSEGEKCEFKLKKRIVIKLLFKFQTEADEMIEMWLKDIYTVSIDVSKQMIVKGLEHLHAMKSKIPEDFRSTNNMFVSYVSA